MQSNHRLKLWLFKYYALISAAAFVATFSTFFILRICGHTFGWEALAAMVGGIISFAFAVQKQQLEEVHLFTKLFKEFNERYDKQNKALNRIRQQTGDQPLTTEEQDTLFEYFNLCGEECLYFNKGFLYKEVWDSWYSGMKIFRNDDLRIKKLWDKELKTGSYYGLRFDEP